MRILFLRNSLLLPEIMIPLISIGHHVKQFACEADYKSGNPEEIMASLDLKKVEVIPAKGATFEQRTEYVIVYL